LKWFGEEVGLAVLLDRWIQMPLEVDKNREETHYARTLLLSYADTHLIPMRMEMSPKMLMFDPYADRNDEISPKVRSNCRSEMVGRK